MGSAPVKSSRPGSPVWDRPLIPLKILVAGGFGVGKTTFVGPLSEIPPLSTEQVMTALSVDVDDVAAVPDKTTTTVAMDFGRITVDDQIILYLFGAPGQDRFWFMWDELAHGAVGAVVLVDLRRLDDCFAAIDYFEDRRIPFAVAVNQFPGSPAHQDGAVRAALPAAGLPADLDGRQAGPLQPGHPGCAGGARFRAQQRCRPSTGRPGRSTLSGRAFRLSSSRSRAAEGLS